MSHVEPFNMEGDIEKKGRPRKTQLVTRVFPLTNEKVDI